jgi:H3 lysine-79-specific histone-lysine N-methyltransferase
MKSYKACRYFLTFLQLLVQLPADFTNPDDPDDKSFEPHPDHYPVVELEYPNHGASERFVFQ